MQFYSVASCRHAYKYFYDSFARCSSVAVGGKLAIAERPHLLQLSLSSLLQKAPCSAVPEGQCLLINLRAGDAQVGCQSAADILERQFRVVAIPED